MKGKAFKKISTMLSIAIMLLITLQLASAAQIQGSCTDSDGGYNIYKKGVVVLDKKQASTETCRSDNSVFEQFCNQYNNYYEVGSKIVVCPTNHVCKDGACVSSQTLPPNGYVEAVPRETLIDSANTQEKLSGVSLTVTETESYQYNIRYQCLAIKGVAPYKIYMKTGDGWSKDFTSSSGSVDFVHTVPRYGEYVAACSITDAQGTTEYMSTRYFVDSEEETYEEETESETSNNYVEAVPRETLIASSQEQEACERKAQRIRYNAKIIVNKILDALQNQ